MAFQTRSLIRTAAAPIAEASGLPSLRQANLLFYATDDDQSLVEGAGYFNGGRDKLQAGSYIFVCMTSGAAPRGNIYIVTAAPGLPGNITLSPFTLALNPSDQASIQASLNAAAAAQAATLTSQIAAAASATTAQNAATAIQTGPSRAYDTLAQLQAVTNLPDGSVGQVVADTDNNGLYSSTAGVWTRKSLATNPALDTRVAAAEKVLNGEGFETELFYEAPGTPKRVPVICDQLGNVGRRIDTVTGAIVDYASPLAQRFLNSASAAVLTWLLYDWNGVIVRGQSLSIGIRSVPPVSITQPYSNISFGSGVRSGTPGNVYGGGNTSPGTTTTAPLVEDANQLFTTADPVGETICSRLCNGLVATALRLFGLAPATNVWFPSAPGRGGLSLPGHIRGSVPWYAMVDHVQQAAKLAAAAGKTYGVQFQVWWQGQADANNAVGVNDNSAYTAYATSFSADIVNNTNLECQRVTGQETPVCTLFFQTSHLVTTTKGQIAQAQYDVAQSNPLAILIAPDWIFPQDVAPYADNLHKSNYGEMLAAEYARRCAFQRIFENRQPDSFRSVSAHYHDGLVFWTVDVPTSVVIDTTIGGGPIAQYGLSLTDGSGANIALTNIQVDPNNGKRVIMTPATKPTGAWTLNVAMDAVGTTNSPALVDVGQIINASSTGACNFRDNTTRDTVKCGGVTYTMWHIPPHHRVAGVTYPDSN